jgi:hypothetical protein
MQCYLTGEPIGDSNRSLEHIIPNALGGVLTSKNILSAKANNALGETLDAAFNKIFAGTYRRMPLKKDRNNKRGITGIHQLFKTEAILKEGRWFPKKPYYDSEHKILYTESVKIGEGFIKHMIKENIIGPNEKITIRTDLSGIFEVPFELNNADFAKGMAKIAAGFAASHGIPRADLNAVIDLHKNRFKDELYVIPYFPVLPYEPIFELQATESAYYPIHGLSLKGDPEHGLLFCYVELFSTFQFIVLLNIAYTGPELHYTYIYDLLNAKELSGTDYIKSILDNELMLAQLKDFKNLHKTEIDEISDIIHDEPEKLRMYTNVKFKQLESFVAITEIAKKMNLIEGN